MNFYKVVSLFIITFLVLFPLYNNSMAEMSTSSAIEIIKKSKTEQMAIYSESYSTINAGEEGISNFSCLDIDWSKFSIDLSDLSFNLGDIMNNIYDAFEDLICDSAEAVYSMATSTTDSFLEYSTGNLVSLNTNTSTVDFHGEDLQPDVSRLIDTREYILDEF